MTSNLRKKRPLPSEIQFFKIILNTSLQDGKLMIPNKFTREYGLNLSNPVFLKSPDSIEWEVYWTKADGGIWLQKGWKEFATYYSLSHGHLVVFNYKEKSCNLEINIFDQSSVEINYPFHDTQNKNDNPDHDQKTSTRTSGVVGQSSNLPEHVQIEGDSFQPQEDRGGATGSLDVEQLTSKPSNRAATFRSKAPSFAVVLKTSYLYEKGYSLIIPSKFAKKYLKEKPRDDILLQVLDGRSWRVSFKLGKFCTGWKTFASDNRLNVGDVCLFELTKSRGHCFKVTIIRLSDETLSPVQGDEDSARIPNLKSTTDISIKAMREASQFTSENPFFKVNIKPDYKGDCRPRIPIAFVRKYFSNKQTVMLQFGKKSWHVNLTGKVRTKLSKGWTLFANESKLRARDVCVFELINKVGLGFDVHVFRGHS